MAGMPLGAEMAYQAGLKAGLSPAQAIDFAGVQYGESGFNPSAVNKSSGAAGLYQLLSPGYVSKANALGGVLNPQANIKAILPDYVSYYQSHPQLVPGAAGAAVERSGEPASYYARGTQLLQGLGGSPSTPPALPSALPSPSTPSAMPLSDPSQALGLSLVSGLQRGDILGGLVQGIELQNLEGAQNSSPVVTDPTTTQPFASLPTVASGKFKIGDPIPTNDLTSIGGEHPTMGLDGFPAHDYFAQAGSPAVAPVGGKVIRLSGHDPSEGPTQGPHGPFGWSVYIQGNDGHTYYLTHMGSRDVKVGEKLKPGQVIGTVGDYAKFGTPSHIHMGVSAA